MNEKQLPKNVSEADRDESAKWFGLDAKSEDRQELLELLRLRENQARENAAKFSEVNLIDAEGRVERKPLHEAIRWWQERNAKAALAGNRSAVFNSLLLNQVDEYMRAVSTGSELIFHVYRILRYDEQAREPGRQLVKRVEDTINQRLNEVLQRSVITPTLGVRVETPAPVLKKDTNGVSSVTTTTNDVSNRPPAGGYSTINENVKIENPKVGKTLESLIPALAGDPASVDKKGRWLCTFCNKTWPPKFKRKFKAHIQFEKQKLRPKGENNDAVSGNALQGVESEGDKVRKGGRPKKQVKG